MQTPDALRTALMAISGRDYPAYRSLLGTYDFGHFIFDLDHIQKDPFAAPTRARLRVSQRVAKFPARFLASEAALVVGLTATGTDASTALAASVAFRLMSHWLVVPIGWVCVAALRRQGADVPRRPTAA